MWQLAAGSSRFTLQSREADPSCGVTHGVPGSTLGGKNGPVTLKKTVLVFGSVNGLASNLTRASHLPSSAFSSRLLPFDTSLRILTAVPDPGAVEYTSTGMTDWRPKLNRR
jgi:hypothetical protein